MHQWLVSKHSHRASWRDVSCITAGMWSISKLVRPLTGLCMTCRVPRSRLNSFQDGCGKRDHQWSLGLGLQTASEAGVANRLQHCSFAVIHGSSGRRSTIPRPIGKLSPLSSQCNNTSHWTVTSTDLFHADRHHFAQIRKRSKGNTIFFTTHTIYKKHQDSAYLCQGASYPDLDPWSGSPPNEIFREGWPSANLPWKFHANAFGSFCAKLLTDRQTDRQTNTKNDEDITSLAEVISYM